MDAIKRYLSSAATVFLGAGLIGLIVWPHKRTAVLVLLGLGAAALAAHVALNWQAFRRGFTRKSFLYSGNLVLVVLLVLAILGLVNYFLSRNDYRADFTADKVHSLSDQSVSVLKALKTDIAFTCFFREGHYGRAAMENLLKLYAYHSGRVKYEFIDPDKNPGLVKRYDITQDGTTVIEAGDKESRITTTTEEDLTNALIKATRAAKKVIYFLEGHGEDSVEESGDNGYSTVKAELEKLGYEVKKQSLALADRFPRDCALLVVPGPQKDLLPEEYETVKGYIAAGGRALFLVDPQTPTLLPLLLADYGFQLENDVVVEMSPVSRLLGGDPFTPVVSEYEPHAITDRFGYATFFPYARSVEAAEAKPEGTTVAVLARTSPSSWSERQLEEKEVKFLPDKDKQGPIGLAAVSSFKAKAVEPPAAPAEGKTGEAAPAEPGTADKEARVAVIGSSRFVKNHSIGFSGNGNFFLNVANWLTEEADLIAIQPKTRVPRTVQLTPSQGRLVFFVSLIGLPLAVLALGFSVWARRRSL